LIRHSRAGDEAAFRALVERHEGQVAATVIGMLGQGAEAEDVGQEVFIRFYRALDHFREEAALSTYLTRIAINLSLNALKKRKRRQFLRFFGSGDEADTAYEVPDTGLTQAQRDTQAMVHQALDQLAPDFRAVVVLRLIEGYSTRETAELLDLPKGTVLSRLSRAQEKLKGAIERLRETSD
jgi:RNA polymerase sigma-70 factor, ECF subfamily